MPLYEHVYLARQDVSAQQVEDLTKQFTTVIEGLGGKVTKNEYWGVKSLNFRIRKNRKAHFTLFKLDAPPAALTDASACATAGSCTKGSPWSRSGATDACGFRTKPWRP